MFVPVHADGEAGECQGERIVLPMRDCSLGVAYRGRSVLFMQSGAQKETMMARSP
jgi:hypothetical protein